MKEVIHQVVRHYAVEIQEIDVDTSPDLQEKYGNEVPVLFINGRKAFKYRATARELEQRLTRQISAGIIRRFPTPR
jgi:hypothetical protein